jgi:hypothetical protein
MLEIIRNAIKNNVDGDGADIKNIILWSGSHETAEEYFSSYLKYELGYKWVGPLDVSLGNIPAWRQFADFHYEVPWCLSITPTELFLGNYDYGVSDQAKKTHEELIKQWIYTEQAVTIQIDHTPGLNHQSIIKHEQW